MDAFYPGFSNNSITPHTSCVARHMHDCCPQFKEPRYHSYTHTSMTADWTLNRSHPRAFVSQQASNKHTRMAMVVMVSRSRWHRSSPMCPDRASQERRRCSYMCSECLCTCMSQSVTVIGYQLQAIFTKRSIVYMANSGAPQSSRLSQSRDGYQLWSGRLWSYRFDTTYTH